jgi:urease accessory protein
VPPYRCEGNVTAGVGGFAGGLLHPLSASAHVVVLIGLGLVAGRIFLPARAAMIVAFALGLAAGLGAIAWGVGETPASDVLLASATLYGLTAAFNFAVPAWLASPMAVVSGIALGLDSPPQAILLGEAVAMLIGTACGGLAALAVIAFFASAIARLGQGIVLRVAGSWIAAIAILVLALRWAA